MPYIYFYEGSIRVPYVDSFISVGEKLFWEELRRRRPSSRSTPLLRNVKSYEARLNPSIGVLLAQL